MAILNPDHLLDQASLLIQPPPAGRPRQVDLRRAISASYYAAFHTVLNAAADEFVGAALRQTREYGLVMRSIDHAGIKTACSEIIKPTPPAKYAAYIPAAGFGGQVMAFASIFPDLQEERHSADYDSLRRYVTSDAKSVIATATQAIAEFRAIPPDDRKALLYLILFPPKR